MPAAPIVILATPRSGSSMTAGIFARHGVWVGDCGEPKPGFNPKGVFENRAITDELKRRYGLLTHANSIAVCKPQPGFRDAVEKILAREGYAAGPWLFKMSALFKNAWHEFNPYFVGLRRENNVESLMTRPGTIGKCAGERTLEAGAREAVRRHAKIIDECDVIVRTDEVVAGNYDSLATAFEYCGLEFDPTIADDFVDPDLWHH